MIRNLVYILDFSVFCAFDRITEINLLQPKAIIYFHYDIKAITVAKHNIRKQRNEAIITRSKYISGRQARENVCEQVTFGYCLLLIG